MELYLDLDFRLSPSNEYWFLFWGILHGVQRKLPDVSGAALGRIFNGY
jgi:hypothetical protein